MSASWCLDEAQAKTNKNIHKQKILRRNQFNELEMFLNLIAFWPN